MYLNAFRDLFGYYHVKCRAVKGDNDILTMTTIIKRDLIENNDTINFLMKIKYLLKNV